MSHSPLDWVHEDNIGREGNEELVGEIYEAWELEKKVNKKGDFASLYAT